MPSKSSTLATGLRLLVRLRKAVLPVGQVHQAGVFQLLVEVLAGVAVEHRVGFLLAGEQERQVEHAQFLDDAHQRRRRGAHHLLGARAQRLRGLQVAARGAAPEGVDLHLAAGLGGQHFLHLLDAQAHRVVLVHAVGELDGAVLELREGGCGGEQGGGRDGHEGTSVQHECLL
jgi:hypothetical protein